MAHRFVLISLLLAANAMAETTDNYFKDEIPRELIQSKPSATRHGGYTIQYKDPQGHALVTEEYSSKHNLMHRYFGEEFKKDNIERTWDENGKLRSVSHYKNGVMDGLFQEWDEDGKLVSNYTMKDGTGHVLKFWSNDFLKEESYYVQGALDGTQRTYEENGKLEMWRQFRLGKELGFSIGFDNGKADFFRTYNDNGQNHGLCLDKFKVDENNNRILGVKFYIKNQVVSEAEYQKQCELDFNLPKPHKDPVEYEKILQTAADSVKDKLIAPKRTDFKE